MMIKKLILIAGLMAILPVMAFAGEPRMMSSHGTWDAYVFTEGDSKVCYMASKPSDAKGKYAKRGDVFALVTHRPSEGTKNVFSYIAGYSYKPGSDATIEIDGQKFSLFTQDDTAWAPDAETDEKISDALKAGKKMIVTGTSSRGTYTTDTFSLTGTSGAHERISKECKA